jgi:hypothetical protein
LKLYIFSDFFFCVFERYPENPVELGDAVKHCKNWAWKDKEGKHRDRIEREKRKERGHALQFCGICVNIIMDWVAL